MLYALWAMLFCDPLGPAEIFEITVRTEALVLLCLRRRKDHSALSMAIVVVLSFFRKEFDGEEKLPTVLFTNRLNDLFIIQWAVEDIGLPSQPVG